MLKRWWMKKYGLPATDPAFTSQTAAELQIEWYEDQWDERHQLLLMQRHRLLEQHEFARLEIICKILGAEQPGRTGDHVIDKFERELAEGKAPDVMGWGARR